MIKTHHFVIILLCITSKRRDDKTLRRNLLSHLFILFSHFFICVVPKVSILFYLSENRLTWTGFLVDKQEVIQSFQGTRWFISPLISFDPSKISYYSNIWQHLKKYFLRVYGMTFLLFIGFFKIFFFSLWFQRWFQLRRI